jgi:hypothetical protein
MMRLHKKRINPREAVKFTSSVVMSSIVSFKWSINPELWS